MSESEKLKTHTLNSLYADFKVNKKQVSSYILMLYLLKPGDKFKSELGTISKLDNGNFSLSLGKHTVNDLIDEWVTDDVETSFGSVLDELEVV